MFDLSSKNSNEEFFHESMGAIVEARVSHSQSILVQNQPFGRSMDILFAKRFFFFFQPTDNDQIEMY